ncbi:MAG: hypothetical protein ACLPY1_19425 [Terracidiphilus sp.]
MEKTALNLIQSKLYRSEIAKLLKKFDFTYCCTLNLHTSHQTIERAERVAKDYLWHLNKEAFTKKGLKNGRRLSFIAVVQGRERSNLHLHCAIGNFNKHHDNERKWWMCGRAAAKTPGVWVDYKPKEVEDSLGRKPTWDEDGWIDYILRENIAYRNNDETTLETRNVDRILVNLISKGN